MSAATVDAIAFAVVMIMFGGVVWSLFGPLLRDLLTFLQPRQPGESRAAFFKRVQEAFLQEQERKRKHWIAEQEREAIKYGSRKKTQAVHLLNLALLLGSLYLVAHVPQSLGWVVGYVVAGLVANTWLDVVRFEGLPPLKRSERQLLHLFYAWFWPLYIWAWLDARKQQHRC